MAHYKRKRPRSSAGGYYSSKAMTYRLGDRISNRRWTSHWPRWWDKVFHTRPARARTRALGRQVVKGADPDGIAWPRPGRPHVYYW